MTQKTNRKKKTVAYQPTPLETDVVAKVLSKSKERPRAPKLKMDLDKATRTNVVGFDHEDQVTSQCLAMHELGTDDPRFYVGLVRQIAAVGENGNPASQDSANFTMSVIRAVAPKDEVETMLAVQMAAVHQATMLMARRLTHAENIPQQDAAERAFNKLARTYSMQMDTLKRYRSKGQQVVRVERVTVNEGGKAIVGPVQHGGGGEEKK